MDGVNRLVKVVQRSGVTDVGLSVIACRALFNYCLDAEEEPLEVCLPLSIAIPAP